MHDNEVKTDEALVRRLLAAQFPQWADLPIHHVDHAGTDNAIYRLGEDMSVRMPRIDWAIEQVEREHEWLPRLAPYLPLAIPVPLVVGTPAEGYPWRWAVHRWLEGENATADSIDTTPCAPVCPGCSPRRPPATMPFGRSIAPRSSPMWHSRSRATSTRSRFTWRVCTVPRARG